jgi:hypothetical protein
MSAEDLDAQAYQAAQNGKADEAIDLWYQILDDKDLTAEIQDDEYGYREIGWNLAMVELSDGQVELAQQTLGHYGWTREETAQQVSDDGEAMPEDLLDLLFPVTEDA